MIIFLNDDAAYRWWIGHHRGGFVLDGRRRPKLGHLVLHRATCGEISSYHSTRRHWTTGSRLKAVSLNREELIVWASAGALPKLAREVLDYVLEAALIHMEHQQPPYRLTLGEIAACFGKTPGQVTPVVGRLIDEGWLTLVGPPAARRKLRRGVVAPTVQAMRSLAAFQAETDAAIQAELEKLNGERRTSVPLVQSL
jgi:DNA-binding MarR family transcriptional regulator